MKKNIRVIKNLIYIILKTEILGKKLFINRYVKALPVIKHIIFRVEGSNNSEHAKKTRAVEYKKWIKKNYPTEQLLSNQKKDQQAFKSRPKISILLPTYNTNILYLEECIRSVINQTYDNWELCIADDASSNNDVINIIEKFSQEDKRIKYLIREKNGHICEATNSALSLASGKFVALLDHDDVLWPNALYEVVNVINKNKNAKFIYSDEDKIDVDGITHRDPFFKPDWSPEFLRSINYITHFAVIDRQLVEKVGKFRKGYEGAQDWDLFLRISRETNEIYHLDKIVYSWRMSKNSTAMKPSSKNYAYLNQKKALEDDIKKRGLNADVEWEIPNLMWRVKYQSNTKPLVSIIIPTKNQYSLIKQCINSILDKTNYSNYEIIIVDTGSTEERVWNLYEEITNKYNKTKIVKYSGIFNFSSACNLGAVNSRGEYFVFLNNDTEVITHGWIEDMLGYASQKEIGVVGCKLYYPDKKIQHAGIILGVGGQNGTPGIAGHFFPAYIDTPPQDVMQNIYIGGTRNFAAVTAACVMVGAHKFKHVNGFDEKFQIAFNDVDLCLKILESGWRNVYLPHVKLFHHESVSVGQPGSKQRDLNVFNKEIHMMLNKWGYLINDDPYYHKEFRRDTANARLKT